MKKRLNIEGITNELKGGSAFFPDFEKEEANQQADNHTAPPATRHPEPLPQASANANSDKESASKAPLNKLPHYNAQFQYQEPVQPKRQIPSVQDKSYKPERANVPTPARPNGKRIITRNSFETYEDQMDALRRLSFKEKMEGKIGSMSKMVRDAIDEYLDKRSSEI